MTAEKLADAQGAVLRLEHELQQATWRRNGMIRRALRDGWTHAQVAEATGLTRGRIGQLAK